MKINEIFRSIQGESSYVGKPCIFIRLTGCNLRCKYCDTKYAYDNGKEMSIDEIVENVKVLYKRHDIIEITGGEPLMHIEEVKKLVVGIRDKIRETFDRRVEILIETNGSIKLPEGWNVDFIMDWKCPSSGVNAKMEYENLFSYEES